MSADLDSIIHEAREAVGALAGRSQFEALKARFLGPNGSLTEAVKGIRDLPREERPAYGKRCNQIKTKLEAILATALKKIGLAELQTSLGPPVDPSLPSPDGGPGGCHLLSSVREEICRIFHKVGFNVEEGTEVETEFYCFDALNFPSDHPAKDVHDTYLLPSSVIYGNVTKRDKERYLLRTHTSTVQVRVMMAKEPPLRFVSPGRCFRRDTADPTHTCNFLQLEGLYVDRQVTVKDLKALLDYFVAALFGKDVKTRFRPSFFPFTEPSFEMDFKSPSLGKLSNQWIEIMGCGMVDPAVFEAVGYDPEVWKGYAFGMGVERVAQVLYGVDDIRYLYQNDLRFLKQFA